MSWPWNELGLPGPAGLPDIRKAYAQRLKTTHPEEDPEGFQRLHAAYQEASRRARRAARTAPEAAEPAPEPPRRAAREDDPQKTREAETWDYDELLEGREAPKKPPENAQQPRETDWDYDELLEEEPERPAKEEARSAGWDYERLFAEGEAEAREARRRKLEELRRKNRDRYAAKEQEQRRRAADEEESWSAVMAAAHALELLYANGAPLLQWRRFLNDPVFWNVRANLDFIFALEDFLEQHPDLPPDIRWAIFTAYGFEKGPGSPVYKRLYRLLNVDRREKRRMRKAGSRWRAAWRSYPPWRKAVIVACFSILALFFVVGWTANLRQAYRDFAARRAAGEWEAQSVAWLEEDFGEPFVLADGERHLYTPASDPTLYFWALPEGERTADGQPGYRTDYPHMRVMRAMEDFAAERELGLDFDSAGSGYSGKPGDAPGAYLFDLPLRGAEEAITALGALVEELEGQDWYRLPAAARKDGGAETVEFQIFLCHNGLSFYDAISTREGGFDKDIALVRYETAGNAYCRYIVEHSGLAARHMGEGAYILLDWGTASLEDKDFFLVTGAGREDHEPLVRYLMAEGGTMIFCVPESKLEDITSLMDLYLGISSFVEVEQAGRVMVWDQV